MTMLIITDVAENVKLKIKFSQAILQHSPFPITSRFPRKCVIINWQPLQMTTR